MTCPSHSLCGDGQLTADETCDDGNTVSGDGCNATCFEEPGWTCVNNNTRCLVRPTTFSGRVSVSLAGIVLGAAIVASCLGCALKWWSGNEPTNYQELQAAHLEHALEAEVEEVDSDDRDVLDDYSSADEDGDLRLGLLHGDDRDGDGDVNLSDYAIRDVEPGLLVVGDNTIFRRAPVVIRFIGETEFAEGEWVGVELLKGRGKHDGRVQGMRYFSCDRPGNVALFCRRSALGLRRKKDKQKAAKRAAELRPRSARSSRMSRAGRGM